MSDGISRITEKVYTDEAISPAGIVITPPKYRQMRLMAYGTSNKTEIFLKQARFMQDYTDILEYKGEFKCFYPTYEDMTTQQLRGYFTWRTFVRQGIYKPACTSFIFVHIYELLNGIGAVSAQDAHDKLVALYNAYSDDDTVCKYLELWIEDHAVYHGLEYSEPNDEQTKNAEILYRYEQYSPEDVFCALNALSSYDIKNSRIYSQYPKQTLYTVYYSYCNMCLHYKSIGDESFFMRLLGSVYTAAHEMFAGALVTREHHCDETRQIGAFKSYECKNGQWRVTKIFTARTATKNVAAFLKGIDHLLRKTLGVTPLLKNAELNSVRSKAVDKAIAKAIQTVRENAQREAIKSIKIDVGVLDGIRKDADIVAQRLTVDETELLEEETRELTVNAQMNSCSDDVADAYISEFDGVSEPQNAISGSYCQSTADADSAEGRPLLDKVQREYLRCLICGSDAKAMLRKRGIMQSVISESINRCLYEIFNDTVLDGDGNIIDDYLTQLKGIIDHDDT